MGEIDLLKTMDAREWAREFIRVLNSFGPSYVIDEAWMTSWFANAIMKGYDEGRYRKMKELAINIKK